MVHQCKIYWKIFRVLLLLFSTNLNGAFGMEKEKNSSKKNKKTCNFVLNLCRTAPKTYGPFCMNTKYVHAITVNVMVFKGPVCKTA